MRTILMSIIIAIFSYVAHASSVVEIDSTIVSLKAIITTTTTVVDSDTTVCSTVDYVPTYVYDTVVYNTTTAAEMAQYSVKTPTKITNSVNMDTLCITAHTDSVVCDTMYISPYTASVACDTMYIVGNEYTYDTAAVASYVHTMDYMYFNISIFNISSTAINSTYVVIPATIPVVADMTTVARKVMVSNTILPVCVSTLATHVALAKEDDHDLIYNVLVDYLNALFGPGSYWI